MIDTERYNRQIILPEIGIEGQKRLAAASVVIIGLGGLGAPVATYLTGAGIGRIGLCDSDTVSLSNLQRQVLYTSDDIGESKVKIAKKRLTAMNPELVVDTYPEGLNPCNAADIIARYDLIIDCCDNFATRYLIDDTCSELGKTWIYGSIGAFMGQVSVMNGISGTRYLDLYPDRDSLCARPRIVAGVLGAVPGVTGAVQASEAIKTIAGFGETLDGKLLSINLLTLQTDIIKFK